MDMNDPFEMRPQWTQEHQDHQTECRNWRNKMAAGMPLMICTTEGLKPGGVVAYLGAEPKQKVENMWGFADEENGAVMEFLHHRFRILSLVRHVLDVEKDYQRSRTEDLLMWAHYADMFQGVAILLDPGKMNCGIRPWKERPGWPIRYKTERMSLPVWFYDCLHGYPVPITEEMNNHVSGCIMTLIRTKAVGWRYERETRLIYDTEKLLPKEDFNVIWDACPECKANKNPMEKCQHRLVFDAVKFPPDAVAAVIFGPECPIEYVEPITKILREDRYKHAKLYRSVFHGQDYRLQYMRSNPDDIETFQRAHTERVAMSKGNVKPTADGFSMPKFASRKGVNLNRKPISQTPIPEAQPEVASQAPAKPRKTMKISDVKGRKIYGNPFDFGPAGVDIRTSHPTKEDIQKAIDDGYFIDRPFSGNQQPLLDEWIAASGRPHNRAKFIEIATRWHAGRIAALVRDGCKDPIGVRADDTIHDGQHRLMAAEFRGDEEIEAEIG